MKQIYLFVLLVAMAVALNTSCSEQADFPKLEDTEITAKFDVKLAKEAFVRDYTAAVEARSETTRAQSQIYYTLADTDYTPLWDKAKNTENDHVLSIDVPLYSVSGAFASDTDGENMRMATQKLVFTKSKKDNKVYSYLLTLCPDVACAEKYSDLNDVFTHLGDCSKFSGLAIYTSLAGELVAVNKFVNGSETGYVYVGNPEADQHALHHQAEHLMEGMKFYLSSGPVEMTRGGGGGAGTGYEDLCADCLKNPCECDIFTVDRCWACGKPIIEHAIYGKCECYGDFDICPTCGRAKPQEGESGGAFCQCGEEVPGEEKMCEWCNMPRTECICVEKPDTDFCDDCHFPKDACICDFFEGEGDPCNFCDKVVCECPNSSVGCPKCGDITCTGCEGNDSTTTPSTPSNPIDPNEPDRCPYCNNYCEGHCEAYCEDCKQLKTDCTEHRCSSCNELYNECECK
ncbi:MAG: hypothetical protein IKU92_03010 [Rikenellaceae bacterium]|nr:hypothetical protein [Rikenellaceae bacterium]